MSAPEGVRSKTETSAEVPDDPSPHMGTYARRLTPPERTFDRTGPSARIMKQGHERIHI